MKQLSIQSNTFLYKGYISKDDNKPHGNGIIISKKQGNIIEGWFAGGYPCDICRYINKKYSLQGTFHESFEVTERDKYIGDKVNAWTVKFIGTVTEPCYFRGVILH